MLKYVPVLRFRQQERKAFNDVIFSNKSLPMIELVTEKLNTRSTQTSIQNLLNDLTTKNIKVIVDIPTYITIYR